MPTHLNDGQTVKQSAKQSTPILPLAKQHCIVEKVDPRLTLCDQQEVSA